MSLSTSRVGTIILILMCIGVAWALFHHAAPPVSPQQAAVVSVSPIQRDAVAQPAVTVAGAIPAIAPVPVHAPDQKPGEVQVPAPMMSPTPITATGPHERLVADTSPIPTGGKPVAHVEVTWRIRVSEDGSQTFSGDLECTPRSNASELSVRCTAVDGATLTSPEAPPGVVAHVGEARTFPLSGTLTAGSGAVVAMVTLRGYDVRSRVVRIELSSANLLPKDTPKLSPSVEVVTDSQGGTTLLMPTVEPPAPSKP